MTRSLVLTVFVGCLMACMGQSASAQEGGRKDEHGPIEFSHPMVTESPSPDTKLRVDFVERAKPDSTLTSGTVRLEGEYAFQPWVSLAVTVPFEWRGAGADPRRSGIASTEVALKLASFALADRGLLLGGGLSSEMPTGSDANGIGSSHIVGMEPFADVAMRRGSLELVTLASYSESTRLRAGDSRDRDWSANFSALWHLTARTQGLVELDTRRALAGSDGGSQVTCVSPGVKLVPLHDRGVMFGASLRIPISTSRDFDRELLLSTMYHF